MKNRSSKEGEEKNEKISSPNSIGMKRKKNMMRLGGPGLSLEAFANAKSTSNQYNPALIKKQREFYKNAKYVRMFKKKLKQQNQPDDHSSVVKPMEDKNESGESSKMMKKKKNKKNGSYSLREMYEKQHKEKEEARIEREAIIKAKKEERGKALAHRKAERGKMYKKTRHGQPVMKYRIEHLLQTIQGSN
ncbi:hypothetical protein P3X46_015179 [Hevea brasiliensis]|uniref:rRNA-processing protein FYV7 n=1 Tax=Hevea brasiliensis TaxID=3981 RepID=A0ABQ9LXJ4_HEVBR|nr:uncharacterized protein LOC110643515 [Hevea brasiliensis]KAJ9171875.1 hypothetical protein P3X46_015179 [Hevea brasiliensis]